MVVSTAIYPSLFGKVVLITGGAEGIGAAAVKLFCRQGSQVAFFDVSESSSNALIEDTKKFQAADESRRFTVPTFYQCDVTNLDQLKENAEKVLKDFQTVDVLINSAAAAGAKSRVPSTQVTAESWDFDVNVNLRHVFFLTQFIVPTMERQKSGNVRVLLGERAT